MNAPLPDIQVRQRITARIVRLLPVLLGLGDELFIEDYRRYVARAAAGRWN